jgi:glycosyltransferase involved in cell wall biosynthesis
LIVRNAEATLGRALASARPFVEELVVVDTGSTDATPEVARAAGANLFEFAWCDDFSAARNYSLDQATCDWILWIDADDELPAASGEILRRAIAEHPQRDAAFWVTVEERSRDARGQPRLMGHAHVKVFPRHPAIRFQYRLHEQIAPSIHALGLPILPTGAAIRHHADRSPAAEEARRQRNLRLAELDLAERPDDPFVHLSLGTSCLFLPGALPRAIEHLRQSVAGLVPGSPTQLNALLYLGQALGTGGDRQAERQLYEQALASFPDDAVLLMRLGNLCERMGQLDEAIRWYESCLARGRVRMSVAHLRGGQARVALRLGQSYLRLGQRQRARELWQEFLSKQPRATAVQRALASLERPARADATGAAAGQGATRFLIVIPAHNVRPFLAPLVASLAEQSWPHWQALFIDDASTDGTLPALADLLAVRGLTSRFTLMQNRQRRYKAYAVYHALADRGRPDDVVVMLDGDDHLASSEALARLATEYEQGWEVVWSNWRGSGGSSRW